MGRFRHRGRTGDDTQLPCSRQRGISQRMERRLVIVYHLSVVYERRGQPSVRFICLCRLPMNHMAFRQRGVMLWKFVYKSTKYSLHFFFFAKSSCGIKTTRLIPLNRSVTIIADLRHKNCHHSFLCISSTHLSPNPPLNHQPHAMFWPTKVCAGLVWPPHQIEFVIQPGAVTDSPLIQSCP